MVNSDQLVLHRIRRGRSSSDVSIDLQTTTTRITPRFGRFSMDFRRFALISSGDTWKSMKIRENRSKSVETSAMINFSSSWVRLAWSRRLLSSPITITIYYHSTTIAFSKLNCFILGVLSQLALSLIYSNLILLLFLVSLEKVSGGHFTDAVKAEHAYSGNKTGTCHYIALPEQDWVPREIRVEW